MSETRTVVRPIVCPFCGSDLDAALVRRVVSNIYEMACGQCECKAVIHSGDQIALPSPQVGCEDATTQEQAVTLPSEAP